MATPRLPHSVLRLLLCLLLMLPAATVRAQLDSLVYVSPDSLRHDGKGELRLEVENLTFLRDNEYKSACVKGYTLPGLWLMPTFTYQPLHNLQLSAGMYMLHYWGANKYPNLNYSDLAEWKGGQTQRGFHILPVFRAHFKPTRRLDIVLGTLYGKANHGLVEPLYSDENMLSTDPETGAQVRWRTRVADVDAWINWESFIFRNDNHQESFSFGLSTRLRPSRQAARMQWYLPVQLLFQHRGGEVNTTAADREVKTWLNAAVGAGFRLPLHTRIPVVLTGEATASWFSQQSGTALPFDKGYGLYARLGAEVWRCRVQAGYWQCHDFITLFGNPHFGAVSIDDHSTCLKDPKMLTAHLEYAAPLGKGFAWGLDASTYAQLPVTLTHADGTTERKGMAVGFAAGIYLHIYPSFLLRRW